MIICIKYNYIMLNKLEKKLISKLNNVHLNKRTNRQYPYECFLHSETDYHAFKTFQYNLRSVGLNYKYEEIEHFGGYYNAIFWCGKKPTKYINRLKKIIFRTT